MMPLISRLYLSRRAVLAVLIAAQFASAHAADGGRDFDALLSLDLGKLAGLSVSTASRHPEQYARSPGTLLVVTRQQIRERGYRTLAELLTDLPSLDVQNFWLLVKSSG